LYQDMNLQHLVSHWRSTFNRANVVVFPDFALPVKNATSVLNYILFLASLV
jgi:hypothetical protein